MRQSWRRYEIRFPGERIRQGVFFDNCLAFLRKVCGGLLLLYRAMDYFLKMWYFLP